MSKIEALIFDLEGVIIDTENTVWDEVARRVLTKRGRIYDKGRTKPLIMGTTIEGGAQVLKQLYDLSDDIEQIAQERRDLSRQLLGETVEFMPGFLDFFKTIRERYKTAIATSLERNPLNSIVSRLNLNNLFGGNIYSIEDIGFIPKPHPDIYLYAARNLGVLPTLSVGIEDAPNGIEALKRAGMKSVGITTSTARERLAGADLIVDSFSEIDLSKL